MNVSEVNNTYKLDTVEKLRKIYKTPKDTAIRKQTDHITEPGQAMIEASPMIMIATANSNGVDVSPKGDQPGFVYILDEKTLLIPDRPGNNRIDGISNLIENPKIGIIFLVPGNNSTYRVNGTAHVSNAPELLQRFLVNDRPPKTVLVVKVEEAFSHCPKAFIRADLWSKAGQGHPENVPNHGTFAAFRDGGDEAYAKQYVEDYKERLPKELY